MLKNSCFGSSRDDQASNAKQCNRTSALNMKYCLKLICPSSGKEQGKHTLCARTHTFLVNYLIIIIIIIINDAFLKTQRRFDRE